MYAYYHEHFEMLSFAPGSVRITCTCGQDFFWSVRPGQREQIRCPHCRQRYTLAMEGEHLTLTREKTGARISLRVTIPEPCPAGLP